MHCNLLCTCSYVQYVLYIYASYRAIYSSCIIIIYNVICYTLIINCYNNNKYIYHIMAVRYNWGIIAYVHCNYNVQHVHILYTILL